ncbi:Glu/Leu/Phe/Val dehydrogenase [Kineosporia mesophila]|uniref:Glu/Leu/Phe/Val dehydrogenase n=2 Tax=Kineosporia mesophila TaxID=566012 RepID=A0ABP7AN01_9ACTN
MIGIDSARLGPALGGCRIKPYDRWQDGLDDVLRLSAAMTRKAALAGLDHGGGKTVVALDGSAFDRDDLLADIAGLIEDLDGRYITGPDIGTGPADMGVLHRHTPHVLCRPEEEGGSGDSSGPTALGVRSSIEAVCEHLWPGRDLADLRFTLIGLGHVGARIGHWLAGRGARLTVTDLDPGRKTLARQWNATWTTPERALSAEADVLVPCATGGLLTAATTSSVAAGAVVGAANNQLDHDDTAQLLHARGVLWAPDTVVSGGGIIASVARELRGASAPEAEREVLGIGPRLATILDDARARGITPLRASQGLVDLRLRTGR